MEHGSMDGSCELSDADEINYRLGSSENQRNPFHHLNSPVRGVPLGRNENFGAVLDEESSQRVARNRTPRRSRHSGDAPSPSQRARNEPRHRAANPSFYAEDETVRRPIFVTSAPAEVDLRDIQLISTPPRAYARQNLFTAVNWTNPLSTVWYKPPKQPGVYPET